MTLFKNLGKRRIKLALSIRILPDILLYSFTSAFKPLVSCIPFTNPEVNPRLSSPLPLILCFLTFPPSAGIKKHVASSTLQPIDLRALFYLLKQRQFQFWDSCPKGMADLKSSGPK